MELDLPASLSVQPVFNVSLEKNNYGDRFLPKVIQVKDDIKYKINLFLHYQGYLHYQYYLLQWKGYGPENDMWVPEAEM